MRDPVVRSNSLRSSSNHYERPEYPPPTPDSRTRHYEFTDWGPKLPVVVQAWGGPKIQVQVTAPQISATRTKKARRNAPAGLIGLKV